MYSVLVVDDEELLRDVIRRWVDAAGYRAREADSAEEALLAMEREAADIAVCDIGLGGRDGVWLAGRLRRLYPHTAVVMATGRNDLDAVVASLRNDVVDYLLKPFDRRRLEEALSLAGDWHAGAAGAGALQQRLQDRLRNRRASIAMEIARSHDTDADALDSLITMLQMHEQEGRAHAVRVARIALAMGEEMGLDEETLDVLERGALLHDIGKIDMPFEILTKPAPLDDEEWQVMRTHPQVGYDLVRHQPRFSAAAEIVLSHHEAWDGSGYPRRLHGDEIPLAARVLTVADAYDSMTQPHTQRPPMSPSLAVREIERCRGRQFDPLCAEALGPVLVHAVEEHVA